MLDHMRAALGALASIGLAGAATAAPLAPPPAAQSGGAFERWEKEDRSSGPRLASPPVAGAEAGSDQRQLFKLVDVRVEGARAIAAADLAPAYQSYIGTNVSQADLVAIAAAITQRYRNAGFHLSRAIVPPQDIARGYLRIQVIEGSIAEVVVAGDEGQAFGLRGLFDALTDEAPSRLSTVERRLLLANDLPGVAISDTSIEEIGAGSGRFRLKVAARTWRVFAAYDVDNMGSRASGPWQATTAFALNSMIVPGDSLSAAAAGVPGSARELRFGRINYDLPIGGSGVRVGVSAWRSEIWPGDERRSINTAATSDNIEARATAAVILRRDHALWLTGGLGVSANDERNLHGRVFRDRIRYASLTADYKFNTIEGGWTYATASLRQGLGFFNSSTGEDAPRSRGDASPRFTSLRIALSHYQNLAANWSLKVAAGGQIASGPLLSSQQYYLGGGSFGRGFEAGLLGGDNAIAAMSELRYDRSLNFSFINSYQLFGFVEGGAVRRYRQEFKTTHSLGSMGGGVRIFAVNDMQIGLTVAKPIIARNFHDKRDFKFLFSISQAFRMCAEALARCGS